MIEERMARLRVSRKRRTQDCDDNGASQDQLRMTRVRREESGAALFSDEDMDEFQEE